MSNTLADRSNSAASAAATAESDCRSVRRRRRRSTAAAVDGSSSGKHGRLRRQERLMTAGSGRGRQQWRLPGAQPALTTAAAGGDDGSGRWRRRRSTAVAVDGSGSGGRVRRQPQERSMTIGRDWGQRQWRPPGSAVRSDGGSGQWRRRQATAVSVDVVDGGGGRGRSRRRQRWRPTAAAATAAGGVTRVHEADAWVDPISQAEQSQGERTKVKTLEWHLKALFPCFCLSPYFCSPI